jgi:hypothetical protein
MVAAITAAGFVAHPADAGPITSLRVMNCLDAGAGSLRDTVAAVGDYGVVVVDDTLPCSTISLTSGAISIPWNNMSLIGSGTGGVPAISGGGNFGVLRHTGNGTLEITRLTITDGKYQSNTTPLGGCVYSAGQISLNDSTVSNCTVVATGPNTARGGGIYARGFLGVQRSTVTGNTAAGLSAEARGGGVYAKGSMVARYSIFSNNVAGAADYFLALGGGMWTEGKINLNGSLVSGNKAMFAGAIGSEAALGGSSLLIVNSTISGNSASVRFGGIYSHVPLTLVSSTVAFNQTPDGGAVYVVGSAVTLKSSIVADNVSNGMQDDLDGAFTPAPTGYNNLVTSSTIGFPSGTITSCPKLGPLAANGGGAMMTHALLASSPAIDTGSDPFGLAVDQRGPGFPRTAGAKSDIGAFERQGGKDDRIQVGGFEPVCDH